MSAQIVEEFLSGNGKFVEQSLGVKPEVVDNQFEFGPLPKNRYTVKLEQLVKSLLSSNEPVSYSIVHGDLVFTHQNKKYNVSKLLKYANLNHIVFDGDDFKKYVDKMVKEFTCKPVLDLNKARQTGLYDQLEDAEMYAINVYTGPDFYQSCKSFLRDSPIEEYPVPPKEILLTSVMMASGLSKISDTEEVEYTFRGDNKLSNGVVHKRIECIESQGKAASSLTLESHFTSSAVESPPSAFVKGFKTNMTDEKNSTCGVVFTNVRFKNISGLSSMSDVDGTEYLIPPTQMRWKGYQKTGDNQYIFLAQPVQSPTGLMKQQLQMSKPSVVAQLAHNLQSFLANTLPLNKESKKRSNRDLTRYTPRQDSENSEHQGIVRGEGFHALKKQKQSHHEEPKQPSILTQQSAVVASGNKLKDCTKADSSPTGDKKSATSKPEHKPPV